MCLIIVRKNEGDTTIPPEHIKNAWDNWNDDGAGIAFVNKEKDKVDIIKPIWDVEELVSRVEKIEKDFDNPPMIVHLRLKTHGPKDKKNTHPFRLSKNCAVAHNGVFQGVGNHAKKSDTLLFLQRYIRPIPSSMLQHKGILNLIGGVAGGNKLAFIFNNSSGGEVKVINESQGVTIDNLWYSAPNAIRELEYEYCGFGYGDGRDKYFSYVPPKTRVESNAVISTGHDNKDGPLPILDFDVAEDTCPLCEQELPLDLESLYCPNCNASLLISFDEEGNERYSWEIETKKKRKK